MPAKPTAIPSAHKCSLCDLDWKRHGEKPTVEKCVELLKAECSRLRNPVGVSEVSTVVGKPYFTTARPEGRIVSTRPEQQEHQ